jgi:signal transduction histidine kinase
MNHELRTPLNSILGFAQALERDSTLMDTQREHVEIIRRNRVHLLTLLDDILDFAKIDINRLELFPAEFVLSDMLSQLVDMTHLKAEHKGLSFTCEIPDTLPRIVFGNQKRLRQILLNLLGNAVKYTEQGRVTLKVTKVTKVSKVSKVENDDLQTSIVNLQFSISDTGIGIAPDHLETIFQPFQQADPHKLEEGRIGLGLAISKRLVEMMGSQLQVTSTVGQGSTFWFDVELPAIEATRPDVPQSQQDDVSDHTSGENWTTALSALPMEWLATLKQGVEETDVEILFEVIEQIRECDETVADALAQLAEDFEYDKILAVIQHTKKGGDAVEEHI